MPVGQFNGVECGVCPYRARPPVLRSSKGEGEISRRERRPQSRTSCAPDTRTAPEISLVTPRIFGHSGPGSIAWYAGGRSYE